MLYLQEAGDKPKPAIVLLHGGGLSSSQWTPQFEALADDFHLIAPDLPEQGHSAHIKPFTLKGATSQVAEIIRDYVPQRKAHVVGLSLGGAVALELARTMPEYVDHLIITGASAGLSPILSAFTNASASLYRWIKPETLLNQAYKQFNIPAAYRPMLRDDLLHSFDAGLTRNFVRALRQVRLPKRAQALIAVGERETFIAKLDARKMARQIEGARGVIVPQVGHVWNLEAPDLFTQTVRAFVTDAALPSALIQMK